MANEIRFYSTRGLHGCFSNFSKDSVHIDGLRWPTTEHYFQAMKFESSKKDYLEVWGAKGASEAARFGRDRKRPLRRDWERVKEDVMRKALLAKFTQNAELQKILIDTGDAMIIEDTHNDSYWGNGGDDTGKNRLGFLLMELRTRIVKALNDTTNSDKLELSSIVLPFTGGTSDVATASSPSTPEDKPASEEKKIAPEKLRKKARLQDKFSRAEKAEKRKPKNNKNKTKRIIKDDD
eukprot:TRINITY_DN4219_c0_g1_i1.p1 TRINITY_DN4219_c0_g1~~TRINITY_DN4219_c0_g1_i1.p1  ORF type:complete len:236 (+),score=45.17 TRINITY_DN4219_c0_g1_i1:49-756(+)